MRRPNCKLGLSPKWLTAKASASVSSGLMTSKDSVPQRPATCRSVPARTPKWPARISASAVDDRHDSKTVVDKLHAERKNRPMCCLREHVALRDVCIEKTVSAKVSHFGIASRTKKSQSCGRPADQIPERWIRRAKKRCEREAKIVMHLAPDREQNAREPSCFFGDHREPSQAVIYTQMQRDNVRWSSKAVGLFLEYLCFDGLGRPSYNLRINNAPPGPAPSFHGKPRRHKDFGSLTTVHALITIEFRQAASIPMRYNAKVFSITPKSSILPSRVFFS